MRKNDKKGHPKNEKIHFCKERETIWLIQCNVSYTVVGQVQEMRKNVSSIKLSQAQMGSLQGWHD